jgi:tagatose-1,6-bisphosphate aldolase
MSGHFQVLLLQTLLLAVGSGVIGLLCGRYLWPRCPSTDRRPAPAPMPEDDLEPTIRDIEQRLLASESQVQQLRAAVSHVSEDAHQAREQPTQEEAGPAPDQLRDTP